MKKTLTLLAFLFTVSAAVHAQVAPEATGSTAMLDYDLNYSQTADFYPGYHGPQQRGIPSGEVEYMNGKDHTPFSVTYSGGYIIGISGLEEGTGVFQHLLISQGYVSRHWTVGLSDDFGLHPASATTGFSGIPGVGGIPGQPAPGNEPVLSLSTRRLTNTAIANFSRKLTHDISFSADGDFESLRYPDGRGLDVNEVGGSPQINWRLNARSSASAQYNFSRFNYLGSPFTMETQSIEPGYMRVWNRWFKTSFSGGPEWVRSNNDQIVPPSTGIAATAQVTYTVRSMSVSLNYLRAVSAGLGLGTEIGVRRDEAFVEFSRAFGKKLSIGATGTYMRSQGLVQTGVTNGKYGGVHVTKRLGENVTLSASYSVIQQTSSLTLPKGALQGLSQVVGFNIAYHPRAMHTIRR